MISKTHQISAHVLLTRDESRVNSRKLAKMAILLIYNLMGSVNKRTGLYLSVSSKSLEKEKNVRSMDR